MRRIQLLKILFLICFWTFCTIFIFIYDVSIKGFTSEIEGGHYSFFNALIIAVGVTIIGATILGSFDVLYLSKLLRKRPFGITLLTKTIVYLSFILFFTSAAILYIASSELGKPVFSEDVIKYYFVALMSPKQLMTICYWGAACMLAAFVLQVSDKFGQGVLYNFLIGKYHHPKEEERIFMFMDLKSSTTYAEQLGHVTYSRFIQDCFFDLTDVVLKHQANIYQYVGDEVVLSWSMNQGISKDNCLNLFFAYDSILKSKIEYYENEYGVLPEFKAGLHSGKVMIAEIGEIKKELAFHGDSINTAARIQSMCNEFKKRLIISETLKEQLKTNSSFNLVLLGNVILRGKSKPLNLYGVQQVP